MKQEYRHTKPYRGKDPTFENEELIEQAIQEGLICIRCGGEGGSYHEESDGGGSGYLPCFNCGDSGVTDYYEFINESDPRI